MFRILDIRDKEEIQAKEENIEKALGDFSENTDNKFFDVNERITNLETKHNNELAELSDSINQDISDLTQTHNTDKNTLQASINANTTSISNLANTHEADKNSINQSISGLTTDVNTKLDTKVDKTTYAADKAALSSSISSEQSRAQSAEEALDARLVPVETFLKAAEINSEDQAVIDTLKEIQDYITSDKTGAAEMLASIQSNASAIETKQNILVFDNVPTTSSSNPVTSGGTKTYVDDQIDSIKTFSILVTSSGALNITYSTDVTIADILNAYDVGKIVKLNYNPGNHIETYYLTHGLYTTVVGFDGVESEPFYTLRFVGENDVFELCGNRESVAEVFKTDNPFGDMKADVYDPQGLETDVFAYIDDKTANSVLYITQELTEEQKAQARKNIGASKELPLLESPDGGLIAGWAFNAGENAVALGPSSLAEGIGAFAEGNGTEASGQYSHAEGSETKATEEMAHAEGYMATASGYASHAEGSETTASGPVSHAEGHLTYATGEASHAEGIHKTTASGSGAHAEGSGTSAKGDYSHAEGMKTVAAGTGQHVQGVLNVEDTEDRYLHIVGNGDPATGTPSNAHTIDRDGNAWFKGKVYIGGESQDDGEEAVILSEILDESQTDTWSTEGQTPVFYYGSDMPVYKVPDSIKAVLLDGVINGVIEFDDSGERASESFQLPELYALNMDGDNGVVGYFEDAQGAGVPQFLYVPSPQTIMVGAYDFEFTEAGLYHFAGKMQLYIMSGLSNVEETLSLPASYAVQKLKEELLPDTAATKQYVDNNIAAITPFIITVTQTNTDGSIFYTADKTFEEIEEAFSINRFVVLREITIDGYQCYGYPSFHADGEEIQFVEWGSIMKIMQIKPDGTISEI